jgi:hypothetical protein
MGKSFADIKVLIQLQNTQTLQQLTNIIKTQSVQNAKQKACFQRRTGLIKMGMETGVL